MKQRNEISKRDETHEINHDLKNLEEEKWNKKSNGELRTWQIKHNMILIKSWNNYQHRNHHHHPTSSRASSPSSPTPSSSSIIHHHHPHHHCCLWNFSFTCNTSGRRFALWASLPYSKHSGHESADCHHFSFKCMCMQPSSSSSP